MKTIILYLALLGALFSDDFSDYWYSGKGEIAVYDLKQMQYGEVRDGSTVLVFVTEPFSKEKHVKLDDSAAAGNDKTTVMKLNKMKNFITGIYPYSIMTSSFVEVQSGKLLKANTTVQDWCGQTYIQANLQGENDIAYSSYSYFESAGDKADVIKTANLEESILPQIRLNKLTLGEVDLVPNQEQSRLLHAGYQSVKAKVSKEEKGDTQVVTVSYENPLKMKTTIYADTAFPYIIRKWEESYEKGDETFTTVATLKSVNQLAYWQMNSPAFLSKREEIGLDK